MKRLPLTAKNLRILQIGILAVLCLSLVIVAVAGGRCAPGARDAAAELTCFHATELQTAFTEAGFAAEGNLYAYTLTPSDRTNATFSVALSSVSARNDTVEIRFSAANSDAEGSGSSLMQAYDQKNAAVTRWQRAMLDALLAAMEEANGGVAPEGAGAMPDGVLASVGSGETFRLTAGRFALEGGFVETPDAPEQYLLRVQAAG